MTRVQQALAGSTELPPVVVQGTRTPLSNHGVNSSNLVPDLGKTGTPLKDLPASVQTIPRDLLTGQGASMLRQSLSNASGISVGGKDSKGYYDRFLIRGLNVQIYNAASPTATSLTASRTRSTACSASKCSKDRVPRCSAAARPAAPSTSCTTSRHPASTMAPASPGARSVTLSTNDYVTGPTGIDGLNYRIDALYSRSNGFRDLGSRDREIRPELEWKIGSHAINFSLDARNIHETPDSYGLVYYRGTPITGVSDQAKYSTPFASADGTYVRPTLTDACKVNDNVTINSRFSYVTFLCDATHSCEDDHLKADY
ncbi:MAG TPA: Plug domain-containing protein [Burkholderiales bacterium]